VAAIGTRTLTLDIDGDEVAPEVSAATIASAETDSDFVSFADAAAGGGRVYTLNLTMVQDAVVGSLWDRVWAHTGEEIPVVVRPYGNGAASPGQPHFTGTVIITEPDGDLLGGEADASPTARFTTEVSWEFTAKPTRVTA
jgi:hypothetical protein